MKNNILQSKKAKLNLLEFEFMNPEIPDSIEIVFFPKEGYKLFKKLKDILYKCLSLFEIKQTMNI